MPIMIEHENLPEAIIKTQHSLKPFIKPRQKISQIRRIAAIHLSAEAIVERSQNRPLSLIESTCNIDRLSHGIRGPQREYLKCVRSNLKARKEYLQLKNELQTTDNPDSSENVDQHISEMDDPSPSTNSFVDLVIKRQKHERLRIIQDYIELLSQKPAAGVEHLDPEIVLKDVDSLPEVPPEVMNITGSHQSIVGADLRELVDKLEKSVLRAKMLLWSEQKLLAKVKQKPSTPHATHGSRLQALAGTRNELINWIETELATTADAPGTTDEAPRLTQHAEDLHIESELRSVQKQYLRYAKARQSLILTSTMKLEAPLGANNISNTTFQGTSQIIHQGTNLSIIYSYLENMVGISNEQKDIIQQKSYITISLAKQLKEATQGVDRLVEESHLLPAHPLPVGQSKGLENPGTFGDTVSKYEVPNASRRAVAWVHASNSARASIQRMMSNKVEEGDLALKNVQESFLDLQCLLGQSADVERSGEGSQPKDASIWTILDGNLGAIKGEDI